MRIPCNILGENVAEQEGCQKDHLRVSLQAAGQLEDDAMVKIMIYFVFDAQNAMLRMIWFDEDYDFVVIPPIPSCIWCHCLPLDWREGHSISQSLFSPERENKISKLENYCASPITRTW